MATLRLLEEAKRIRDREQTPFDRCWIVFDKDDFSDFNQAIRESKDAGFKVAWSNESFELWYLLHFRYQSTSIDRTKCITYLNKEIQRKVPSFSYNKGRTDMYDILKAYGDRKLAMSGAQRLRSNYTDHDYQKHNPCTHIDELVKDLTDGSVREQILQRGVKR